MEAAAVAFGAAYATGDLFCFLVAMLTMGLIMTGLTLVLAWALTRTAVAHLQIAAAVLLLIAALLWSTLPFSFSGTRSPVTALLFLLASYLIVPLAAILPGMVWFWPGERSCVLKATALCAAATFTVEVLLYLALSFVLPKDQIYSAVLWLLKALGLGEHVAFLNHLGAREIALQLRSKVGPTANPLDARQDSKDCA